MIWNWIKSTIFSYIKNTKPLTYDLVIKFVFLLITSNKKISGLLKILVVKITSFHTLKKKKKTFKNLKSVVQPLSSKSKILSSITPKVKAQFGT